MGLQDVQLRIFLSVNGLSSLNTLNTAIKGNTGIMSGMSAVSKGQTSINWDQVKSFQGLTTQLNNVERNYDAVYRAAQHMTQIGQQLNQVGQAGIGVLKSAVGQWGDFQYSMNRAAGALDVSTDMYGKLQGAITDVAKQVRLFSPNDVAMAMYYWASATGQVVHSTKDLAAIQTEITPILKASAMTSTDMETSIKGVYGVLTEFGLGLSHTTEVTEDLTVAAQKSALEWPDLISAFKMLGPIAHANGVSVNDVTVMLMKLGDAGIKGGQAGRALSQFFTKLVNPTAAAKKSLDDVWQATYHVSDAYDKMVFPKGKFEGMTAYMDQLVTVTDKMTQSERNRFIAQTTTQNESRAIIAMVQREIDIKNGLISADDAAKYSMDGASAAFDKSWGYMASSWQGTVGLLKNSLMPIVLQVGATIAEIATPIIDAVTGWADAFSEWLALNPRIADMAVKIFAIGSVVLAATGSLLLLGAAGIRLGATMKMWGSPVLGIALDLAVLVGIVVGLGYAFDKNTGGIRDAVLHLYAVIHPIFSEASADIKTLTDKLPGLNSNFGQVGTGVIKDIADCINKLADALQRMNDTKAGHDALVGLAGALELYVSAASGMKAANFALDAFSAMAKGLVIFLPGLNALLLLFVSTMTGASSLSSGWAALTFMLDGFTASVWANTVALLANPITWIVVAIVAAVALLALAWANDWGGIREKVAAVWDWIQKNIVPLVGTIFKAIVSAIQTFVSTAVDVFKFLLGALTTIFNTLVSVVTAIWNTLVSVFGPPIQKIIGLIMRLAQPFIDMAEKYAPGIARAIGDMAKTVVSVLTNLWNTFSTVFTKQILPTVQSVINKIGPFITGILSKIGPLLGSIAAFAGALAKKFIDAWNGIVSILQWAWGIFSPIFDQLVQWFTDFVSNYISLLQTAWNDLWSAAQAVAQVFVDFFNNVFLPIWDAAATIISAALGVIGGVLKNAFDFFMTDIIQPFATLFIQDFGVLFDTIGGIVKGAMDIIQGVIQLVLDTITGIFNVFADILNGDWNKLWSDICTLVQNVASDIGLIISGLVQTIVSVISGAAQLIFNGATTAFNEIITVLKSVIAAIWNGSTGLAYDIVNNLVNGIVSLDTWIFNQITSFIAAAFQTLTDLPSTVVDIGVNVVKGIMNGITSMTSWIVSQIEAWVDSVIPGPIKTVLGISSPSKLMASYGKFVVQGLANGINGTDDAMTAMTNYSKRLAAAASTAASGVESALSTSSAYNAGDLNVTTDSTKTINLAITVKSPDGSVSQVDMGTLASLISGSDLAHALQRSAASAS